MASKNCETGSTIAPYTPPLGHARQVSSVTSTYVLGLRLDPLGFRDILTCFEEMLRTPGAKMVVIPNVEFCMAARKDPEFRKLLNESSLSIPDGMGLHVALKIAGFRDRECTTGTDLGPLVASWAASQGLSMFLYGGKPGVAEQTAETFVQRFPELRIVGTSHGYQVTAEEEDDLIAKINSLSPDILIVCLGMRRQERWIARNLARLNVGIVFGNGGAFDFWSGRVRRAPVWMQRCGLEWLFRLIQEPSRWRRQMALVRYVAAFCFAYVLGRAFTAVDD